MNADGTEARTLEPSIDRASDLIWYPKLDELGVGNFGAQENSSGWFTIKLSGGGASALVAEEPRRTIADNFPIKFGRGTRVTYSTNGEKIAGLVPMADKTTSEIKQRLCISSSGGSSPAKCNETVEGCVRGSPVWSPDDSMIVLPVRMNEDAVACNLVELFIIDTNSMVARQLTDVRGPKLTPNDRAMIVKPGASLDYHHKSTHPAWSPDGQWIAFMSYSGIYRIRPDGTDTRLIISDAIYPAWAPDASRLVFVKGAHDLLSIMRGQTTDRLFVARADGSDQTEIKFDIKQRALYHDLNWAQE